MITTEVKHKIVNELAKRREIFAGSDAKFAVSIGINGASYSRIKNGDIEKVLSDQNWISLARQLDLPLGNRAKWNIARTPVFDFITRQLEFCQEGSCSRLLCDVADIGKTFTARHYVREHRDAVYIDCSQVKSKQKLVRQIAREFGIGHTGKYADVYQDLIYAICNTMSLPLIILDEAGDLDQGAFLELKALWNATERSCGWYMMGADGLREKIRRSIDHKKIGYTEIFSRYGSRYQKASPDTTEELREFRIAQAAAVIQANLPAGHNIDLRKLIVSSDYSLRRIQDEIRKILAA
jgi:DNA transposition AAA+ family ATPase